MYKQLKEKEGKRLKDHRNHFGQQTVVASALSVCKIYQKQQICVLIEVLADRDHRILP